MLNGETSTIQTNFNFRLSVHNSPLLPATEVHLLSMKYPIFTSAVSQRTSTVFQVSALTAQAEGKITDRNGRQRSHFVSILF